MGFTAFCVVDDRKQCFFEGLEEGTYCITLLRIAVHSLVITAFA